MRKLTISAHHFDNFLYAQLGTSAAGGDEEWETALRLLKKLKDPKLTSEVPFTAEEQQAHENGRAVYHYRKLREAEATFLLKEDEYLLLKKKITAHKKAVALLAAEDFAEFLEVIRQAPEYEEPTAATAVEE